MDKTTAGNAYSITVDDAASIVEAAKAALSEKTEEYRDLLISLESVYGGLDSDEPCPFHAARSAVEAATLGRFASVAAELDDMRLGELSTDLERMFAEGAAVGSVSLTTERDEDGGAEVTNYDAMDGMAAAIAAADGLSGAFGNVLEELEEAIGAGIADGDARSDGRIERAALEAAAFVNLKRAIGEMPSDELGRFVDSLTEAYLTGARVERLKATASF